MTLVSIDLMFTADDLQLAMIVMRKVHTRSRVRSRTLLKEQSEMQKTNSYSIILNVHNLKQLKVLDYSNMF